MSKILNYSMILAAVEMLLFFGGIPTASYQIYQWFSLGTLTLNNSFYISIIVAFTVALISLGIFGGFITQKASESSALAGISTMIYGIIAADLISIAGVIESSSPFSSIIKFIIAILFVGYGYTYIQWIRGTDT